MTKGGCGRDAKTLEWEAVVAAACFVGLCLTALAGVLFPGGAR